MKKLATVAALGLALTACGGGTEEATPTVTKTVTETATETAPVATEAPEPTDYYGISQKEASSLLECETFQDRTNNPDYKDIGIPSESAGLCVTDNGTHQSAVFIFKDAAQQAEAEQNTTFQRYVSDGGFVAPGMAIGCIDESVCSQFGPLIEGEVKG